MPHQGVEIGPGGDIAFSPDGNTLVYNSISGMFVWDIQSEAVVAELGDNIRANGIAFSPSGQLMANGTRSDEVVSIWDTETWQQIAELPIYQVTDIAFNPNGTLLATGTTLGIVTLWGIPVPE